MKKLYMAILAASTAGASLFAQNGEWCATVRKFQQAVTNDPSIQVQFENFNQWVMDNQQYIMSTSEGSNYVVPVVVHVIHNYGTENISDAQIVDAINILNQDFAGANADTSDVVAAFKSIIGQTNFEFRLAKLDPNGNCTNGITRTVSGLTDDANDNSKVISWPRNKYYNMWIVRDIAEDQGSQGVTAGYATFPGAAGNGTDGILMQHNYVGSIGTANGSNFNKRVITHETGHFFGLLHPWGWGAINTTCGDDFIDDTPETKGSFSTCNLTQSNCGPLENVQNYMDYASCTKMFTDDQSGRMQTVINSGTGQRSSLWQMSNLVATGTNDGYVVQPCAPVVDFKSNYSTVCAGTSVTFSDLTWNATPTSWNWTVTDGTNTQNSTQQNPTFALANAGTYDVTLTVSAPGGNGSLTKQQMIYVFSTSASQSSFSYSDMMDNNPIISGRWSVPYAQTPTNGWEQTTQSSYSAPNAVMVDNFGGQVGNIYNFISPSYDFTTVPQPITFSFKHAFAKRNNDSFDWMKVYVSSNCGQTWSLRATYTTDDLASTTNKTSDWFPASTSLWATKTLTNLNAWYNKTNVIFRFEFMSGGGNNLFIDDINISGPLSVDDASKEDIGLSLYPNPTVDHVNVSFYLDKTYPVQLRLMDITGRSLQTTATQDYPAGETIIPVSLGDASLTPGIYFVEVSIGVKRYVERLVVE